MTEVQTPMSRLQKIGKFVEEDIEKIDGWFFQPDIYSFITIFETLRSSNVTGDIVEVGVYHAKSLVLLSLLKQETQKVWGFDLFPEDMKVIAEQNLSEYGCKEKVTLIEGLTSNIITDQLDQFFEDPISFLHIDAGHEYFEVLEQLEIFSPYLSERAVIAMDDFQDREFPGVSAAVFDFCEIDRPRRFVPFMAGGNKMYLCSPSVAAHYQHELLNCDIWKTDWRISQVKDYQILIPFSKVPMQKENVIKMILKNFHPRRTIGNSKNLSHLYSQLNHMDLSNGKLSKQTKKP